MHTELRFVIRGRGLWRWAALMLALLCVGVRGERLPVKTYTVADGLLRDDVRKIMQDSHGFLWFGTFDGVSRFDGYGFTNFRPEDGLPHRRVNDILETKSGAIWIATDAGLARLNPKGIRGSKENPFFTVYLPDDPKAKWVQVLFEDHAGTLWIGTINGLYKLNHKAELERVPLDGFPASGMNITSFIQDRRGALWIGTFGHGLLHLSSAGQIQKYTTADGLPDDNITALLEDRDGRIWVGFRPGKKSGLVRLIPDAFGAFVIEKRSFTMNDGLPDVWLTDIYQASNGDVWLATLSGLCLWQGESQNPVCKHYTTENGMCDDDVWSVTEDKDGNIWAGSACGAKKLSRYGFTTYTEKDGLADSNIKSIFENAAGDLFVYVKAKTSNVTFSRFDGNRFTPKEINLEKGDNFKQTLRQDSRGIWWIPTSQGLFRYPENTDFNDLSRIAPVEVKTGAASKSIYRTYEDSHGNIWITTFFSAFELLQWERATDTWRNYTKEVGFSSKRAGLVFLEDKTGNLWIATGSEEDASALIRYRDGKFKVFTQEDGAPPGWTKDMFLDRAGRVWLANNIWGLLRLDEVNADDLQFIRYTTADGLSSNGVYCVTEDEFGRIYAGTGSGLDRVNPATRQVENFTPADGLPHGWVNEAYRDRKNVLWFGTTYGLARFVPEPQRARVLPNILITGLRVGGEPQSVSIVGETDIPLLNLNSSQRQITVDFIGLGASLGEKLKYEYRFGDADWTATNERSLNFANLSAGDYKFEVRAQTADRLYSQPATASFRIAAPVWQRWWFVLLTLLAAGGLARALYLYRVRRLLELADIRTRIATDLHDDIGANLTRIALLSEVAQQQATAGTVGPRNFLPAIADIARESVASMNDIVWAVSPDQDSLLDLTRRMRRHAEELFSQREIELSFHAPDAEQDLHLSVGVRRDVLLIFKEAVSNAAKHSACDKVEIAFHSNHTRLMLSISDNGKGFAPENSNGEGQGLRSMTRRAMGLGGKLEITSQPGQGTTVAFTMPLLNRRKS